MEKNSDFFKNAIIGLYQSTPEGTLKTTNPAMAKLLGYRNEKELVQAVKELGKIYVFPNQRLEFIKSINKDGFVQNFVSQVYKKDGSIIWISEDAWPVLNKDKQIIGYQGIVKNITQQRCIEEQIAKKQRMALQAEKFEAIKTMARGISHDFNNILSPIIGYSEMLLDFKPNPEKCDRYVQNIAKAAHNAKKLSSKIHTLAMPDHHKPSKVNFSDLVEEVVHKLNVTIPPSIKIEPDITPDLKPVVGDPQHFYDLVMNLCTNAVHSMEAKGGTLTIKLHQGELNEEFIEEESLDIIPGEFIILHVNDTGIGMPPHVQGRVFDPYFKSFQKGKGLGLSILYSLLKNYHGEIQLKSNTKLGTHVTCYLPVVAAKALVNDEIPEMKHILLVDDDKDVLDIQKILIERLGYKVTAFIDSTKALKFFSKNPDTFDLVLTDMNMPHMTGLELSKSILSIDAKKPIILCTGFSDSVNESIAKRAGIKKFILKPLTMQKLSADIRSTLE